MLPMAQACDYDSGGTFLQLELERLLKPLLYLMDTKTFTLRLGLKIFVSQSIPSGTT